MKYIKESTSIFGKKYSIYLDEVKIKDILINRIVKEYEGKVYYFLIDANGRINDDVFEYLNEYCKSTCINTLEVSLDALKILYSFLNIIGKEFENLNRNDIENLSNFILGISCEGVNETIKFETTRKISTHNLYFDLIRQYAKYREIDNSYLFERRVVSIDKRTDGLLGHIKIVKVNKYTTNKNTGLGKKEYVPKYISLDEYKFITKYLDDDNDKFKLRNKLIIDLMYTRGLRLGEVLGITLEDIKLHPDNSDYGMIILRNRVSDKKDQNAKGCMKVKNSYIYMSRNYNEEGIGYQTIMIPPILMNEINSYVDKSRNIFTNSQKIIDNIKKYSIADTVEGNEFSNYYLFLNKDGNPLRSGGWGKFLKDVFTKSGISIDKYNKRDNLSHRFRHGYAMYLIEIEKKDIMYVKNELRHKSLQSTQRYYNPKPETILNDTIKVQNKMRGMCLHEK